ncbi:hypothetical protein F6Q06_07400 [Pectobacterium parmentieri]|uniref:Uncharacterized protein n=1 Tax=Pectobacterium parmentieri TaxID=1905730 RepID=A0A8B3F0Q1_PECPM|nr:hypothetical protein A8F97_15105 [Pectobacterium parmentieri]AYH00079.1 hypothetical protein C5E26_03455 [Pectobacterium parmentieri]AYH04550.1 hypothetical protein C5E25_03770 [Pectobacterium parmentieri]AYH08827.1 hypothetical protein C5E24_03425 [Pectobacterium parmentieri]AYH13372.1 hypothetical protein C5E23_03750 [Pectobacterium parmentieri]
MVFLLIVFYIITLRRLVAPCARAGNRRMTGKKKLGQKRVSLLTSAQVSPASGGNVLAEHYTTLNLCGNVPVWLCDSDHGITT